MSERATSEAREIRVSRWLALLAVILLASGLAWLGGPGVSPHVAGQPVLLSREAWTAGQYLDLADGWLHQAVTQEDQLLRALGPLSGVDWPVPAGGWPASIYEQARLAQAAADELAAVQNTAWAYAVPVNLAPTHEKLVAYLDASATFGSAILDYLGGPDEAKLPRLVTYWQAAQELQGAARAAVARQRELQGWSVPNAPIPGATPGPAPATTAIPENRPTGAPVFATHTPLSEP